MDGSLRIGVQLVGEQALDAAASARIVEDAGFDLVMLADHVGPARLSPMLNLAAVAQATERIRLGTYVLNNDMRNPVQLAWESATLDRLSGGRFELGLGAGHTPHEYEGTGIALDEGPVRKARLREAVEIIRPLLDGETVAYEGEYYSVSDAQIEPSTQGRLPVLIGVSGASMLRFAGEFCDGVGLHGLGKTLENGHAHEVAWSEDRLLRQVAQVAEGRARHDRPVDMSALVQMLEITDDRDAALMTVVDDAPGLTLDDARATPYLAAGTIDEIVAHFHQCHERYGVTTFVVRLPTQSDIDAFAPILAALR